jgi:hypothetical protein
MNEVSESRHAALRLTETMKMGLAPPMMEAGRPPDEAELYWCLSPSESLARQPHEHETVAAAPRGEHAEQIVC